MREELTERLQAAHAEGIPPAKYLEVGCLPKPCGGMKTGPSAQRSTALGTAACF